MKALTAKMEAFLELKKNLMNDPNFKFNSHELLELEDIPDLELVNENWVKVKVKMGGICGSDLNFLLLKVSTVLSNFASFPGIPGHEIVGNVVEIGENVDNVVIGDRVIIDENLSCEVRGLELCHTCKNGDYSLCCNFDKGEISPGFITGFCTETGGGWGEYMVAHKSQVLKIPDSISDEEALIAEPLGCTIHGVLKSVPRNDETCVVIGCGTMGLATILAVKALSKCKIIAVAKYPFQSELAKNLGADDVFLVKKDLHIKKIARKLGCRVVSPIMEAAYPLGGGADVVIDSIGNESSLLNSLRLVKPKGTVVLIGFPSYVEIDWTPIVVKEINIVGSYIFGFDDFEGERKRTLQVALDLITSGKVNVKDFVTHKFTLDDYKEALDVATTKSQYEATKVVFTYE
jgi:threonine dehydrogenase-like Zn-dependent dehydrogenase